MIGGVDGDRLRGELLALRVLLRGHEAGAEQAAGGARVQMCPQGHCRSPASDQAGITGLRSAVAAPMSPIEAS